MYFTQSEQLINLFLFSFSLFFTEFFYPLLSIFWNISPHCFVYLFCLFFIFIIIFLSSLFWSLLHTICSLQFITITRIYPFLLPVCTILYRGSFVLCVRSALTASSSQCLYKQQKGTFLSLCPYYGKVSLSPNELSYTKLHNIHVFSFSQISEEV